jgi:outer membrane murein-binding lipoprotein Lpp
MTDTSEHPLTVSQTGRIKGMRRYLLIGAAVLGGVVLAGAAILYFHRDKIVTYTVDRTLSKVEHQVVQHWPDARTVSEVQRDFETLHERLQAGTIEADEVKQLAAMYNTSYSDEKLDSAEVRRLAEKVHDLVQEH